MKFLNYTSRALPDTLFCLVVDAATMHRSVYWQLRWGGESKSRKRRVMRSKKNVWKIQTRSARLDLSEHHSIITLIVIETRN